MASTLKKITSSSQEYFQDCLTIYANSFPSGERQPIERIILRVDTKTCDLYCFLHESRAIGMAIIWNFKECEIMFLDYFAIDANYRNKGLGKIFLDQLSLLVSANQKVLGLEVEHPHYGDNVSERFNRLRFYTSNGAKILSNVTYTMPSLDGTDDIEMLLLLLKPKEMLPDKSELEKFISNLYFNVYLLQADHNLVNQILNSIPAQIEISDSL